MAHACEIIVGIYTLGKISKLIKLIITQYNQYDEI